MSRKIILSLAAAATIVAAGLASSAADARGFGGGGFGGGSHMGGSRMGGGSHFAGRGGRGGSARHNPGRGHPGHGGGHFAHNHHHRVFRNGIWIDVDGVDGEVYDAPVAAAPGPCTCLTKTYTPTGLVVFADVCTKEAASARVDGSTADATPVPPPAPTPAPSSSTGGNVPATALQAPTSPNYAGRTFSDYLAANQQAAAQTSPKN
jgi:hypothetical protein